MAYRNPLPQTNLTITDIRDTLGESTTALSALCKSGKINPWSKAKPVGYNRAFPTASDPLWQGMRGTCGLRVRRQLPTDKAPVYTTDPDSFHVDKIPNITCYNWVHNPPSGGAAQPFRMGDFRGYNHTADPVIQISASSNEFAPINRFMPGARTTVHVWYDVLRDGECPSDVLSIEDLERARKAYAPEMEWPDKYYVCVMVKKTSGVGTGTNYYYFSDQPIGVPDSGYVAVYVGNYDIGTYRFSCFLANRRTTPIDYFYPIPWSNACPVVYDLSISNYFPASADIDAIAVVENYQASALMSVAGLEYVDTYYYEQNNTPLKIYGITNFALKTNAWSSVDIDLDKSKFWISLNGREPLGRLYPQAEGDERPAITGTISLKANQSKTIYFLFRGDGFSLVPYSSAQNPEYYEVYIWYGTKDEVEFGWIDYLYMQGVW